eukprot:7409263-Pyramimonas_sp.AAC.2
MGLWPSGVRFVSHDRWGFGRRGYVCVTQQIGLRPAGRHRVMSPHRVRMRLHGDNETHRVAEVSSIWVI